jgi:hypothetical protein
MREQERYQKGCGREENKKQEKRLEFAEEILREENRKQEKEEKRNR